MRRILLASLLLLPGQALAGPPERVSGRIALAPDEVGDGLRRCQREYDFSEKLWPLWRLAKTKDARVAVVLGDSLDNNSVFWMQPIAVCCWGGSPPKEPEIVGRMAAAILFENYLPPGAKPEMQTVRDWWKENEAELRRRAKQPPR